MCGQLGCDVPLQDPGVFGGEVEQQLAAGVGGDAFAEVAGQLGQMLMRCATNEEGWLM